MVFHVARFPLMFGVVVPKWPPVALRLRTGVARRLCSARVRATLAETDRARWAGGATARVRMATWITRRISTDIGPSCRESLVVGRWSLVVGRWSCVIGTDER